MESESKSEIFTGDTSERQSFTRSARPQAFRNVLLYVIHL